MDRLVIESTLSDLSEVYYSDDDNNMNPKPAIVLGFKASHTDQIIHAFSALKNLTAEEGVEFLICRTLVPGIYDLEIKSGSLDEPVRIMNKAISNEKLGEIEDQLLHNKEMILTTNVSEEENWIKIHKSEIKDCPVKQ